MAKDDFDYIAFKILAYYYAWLRNKVSFDDNVLRTMVMAKNVDDVYFMAVLRSLVVEGYLEGLTFVKAWGGVYLLANDLIDGSITHAGVQYLRDNSNMQKAKELAEKAGGLIASLIPFVFSV